MAADSRFLPNLQTRRAQLGPGTLFYDGDCLKLDTEPEERKHQSAPPALAAVRLNIACCCLGFNLLEVNLCNTLYPVCPQDNGSWV